MALPLGRPSPVFGVEVRVGGPGADRRDDDGRREGGASRARGEAGRRGSRAREAGVRRGAADGAGGRGGRGRREGRALAAEDGAAERASGAALGDTRGPGGSSRRSRGRGGARASPPVSSRAGPRRRSWWRSPSPLDRWRARRAPGGLRARGLDARRGRPGARQGRDGRLEEPGEPALRGDRRAGGGVPLPPDRGPLALSVARRHRPEGARGRRSPSGSNRWRLDGSPSAGPSWWRSRWTRTAGARRWARPPGPRKRRCSGAASRAASPTGACAA